MNRFILTIISLFMFTALLTQGTALAMEPPQGADDKATQELHRQKRNPKVPNDSYWDKVAWCETNRNWQDRGRWAGGLGIYVGTWVRYGGRQYAPTPDKATRTEQLVIANRIAVIGYQSRRIFLSLEDKQNNKPHFMYPVGFNGWGCIKNYIGPPKSRKVRKSD